jgi:hypothetical protein
VSAETVTATGSTTARALKDSVLGPAVTVPAGLALAPAAGALPTGTYKYWVSALSSMGETTSAMPVTIALAGPAGIRVSWTPSPGATGYRIYGRVNCNTACRLIDVGTVTSWTDDGSLTPGAGSPNGGYPTSIDSSFGLNIGGNIGIGSAPRADTTLYVAPPATDATTANGFLLKVRTNNALLPRDVFEVDGHGGTHVRDYLMLCQSDWARCLSLANGVGAYFGGDGDAAGQGLVGIVGGVVDSANGDFLQMRTYANVSNFYQMPLKFVFHDSGVFGFGDGSVNSPALKPNGTELEVRSGTDSRYAGFKAWYATFTEGLYLGPASSFVAATDASSPVYLVGGTGGGADSAVFCNASTGTCRAKITGGGGVVPNTGALALPACGSQTAPEGTITTVPGSGSVPTKICACTYTPTGTAYAWVNLGTNSAGTGIGTSSTCP